MQTRGNTHNDDRRKQSAPPVDLKPKQQQATIQEKRNKKGSGDGEKQQG